MPKTTINEFVAEPFTNTIGQVIQPGDRVAYVTRCSGRVYQGSGWFDGVMKDRKTDQVNYTQVRGIRNKKSVATGKMIRHSYSWLDSVKTYEYPEYIEVDIEPHGKTNLQRHLLFKI